jgi:hypothetical protein
MRNIRTPDWHFRQRQTLLEEATFSKPSHYAMKQKTYSTEEIARRGEEIYEEKVRPNVGEDGADRGKFVAIDIETEDYELGSDSLEVMNRLEKREPEARGRIWLTRVGLGYAVRFGGRRLDTEGL